MIRRNHQPGGLNLTDEEKAVLRSSRTPQVLRDFLNRRTESIDAEVELYRKATVLARARRESLMQVANLIITEARIESIENATTGEGEQSKASRIVELERQNRELMAKLDATQEANLRQLSVGEMVAHGD